MAETNQLVDFDHDEPTNITTDGYVHAELSRPYVGTMTGCLL